MDLKGDLTLESEFDSISNQVKEDLLQSLRVCVNVLRHLVIELKVECQILGIQLKLHDSVDFINSVSDVESFIVDLKLVVLKTGYINCIVDYVLQMNRAGVDELNESLNSSDIEGAEVTVSLQDHVKLQDRDDRV